MFTHLSIIIVMEHRLSVTVLTNLHSHDCINFDPGYEYLSHLQVSQTLMVPGPDVLTSCGQYYRVLTINQQYVVGVGGTGPCDSISDWSTLSLYSSNELQQLRSLAQQFEAGSLDCGAFGLLPSFSVILAVAAIITLCQSLLA